MSVPSLSTTETLLRVLLSDIAGALEPPLVCSVIELEIQLKDGMEISRVRNTSTRVNWVPRPRLTIRENFNQRTIGATYENWLL